MVASIDTNSINALTPKKSDAKSTDLAKARTAAQQFDAFFLNYLMKEMKQNTLSSGLFGEGLGSDTYTDLFNEELSKVMSERGGIGLADMLVKHLQPSSAKPVGKTKSEPTADSQPQSSIPSVSLSSTG